MKLLLFCGFLALFLLGLCEFLHFLKLILIFPKRKMHSTMVVMLKEDTAIKQTVFVGEQFKWLGDKFADRVIVVAEDLSCEAVAECKEQAEKYNLKFVVKGKG